MLFTGGSDPVAPGLRTRAVTTPGYTLSVPAAAAVLTCSENDVRRLLGLRVLRCVEIGLACSSAPPRVLRQDVDVLLARRAGHPVRLAVGG